MGDAVSPGAEGAAAIVALKAPPQLKMNVLAQVAALFGVGFVGAGEAVEGGAELIDRVPVQAILIGLAVRNGFCSLHIQGSRCGWEFLTVWRRKCGCGYCFWAETVFNFFASLPGSVYTKSRPPLLFGSISSMAARFPSK